jgi:hypothetical protein
MLHRNGAKVGAAPYILCRPGQLSTNCLSSPRPCTSTPRVFPCIVCLMRMHDMTSNAAHRNCTRDRHVVAVTARVMHVFDACTLEPLYAMHSQRSVSLHAMQHRTWDRGAGADP